MVRIRRKSYEFLEFGFLDYWRKVCAKERQSRSRVHRGRKTEVEKMLISNQVTSRFKRLIGERDTGHGGRAGEAESRGRGQNQGEEALSVAHPENAGCGLDSGTQVLPLALQRPEG